MEFSKLLQSINYVLKDLLNGEFINVSASKKHDIIYKKYRFVHGFISNDDKVVHEALTIYIKAFDETVYNNVCPFLDEEEPEIIFI